MEKKKIKNRLKPPPGLGNPVKKETVDENKTSTKKV